MKLPPDPEKMNYQWFPPPPNMFILASLFVLRFCLETVLQLNILCFICSLSHWLASIPREIHLSSAPSSQVTERGRVSIDTKVMLMAHCTPSPLYKLLLWLLTNILWFSYYYHHFGLPRWCSSKESVCQCRRHGFNPWVGKIPLGRKWQPTSVFLPGKSQGQRRLVGYSSWGHKESDRTEHMHTGNYTQIKKR